MMGEKSPREHKISPIWFPSNPPSITWRADCFPAPRVDRKQAGLSLQGKGPMLVGIKEQGGKGTARK